MEQRKRLTQIGNIRALAIFLVVLGHSIILYSSNWDLYSTTVSVSFLDQLKNCIDFIQMPLFFSLSGYLFVLTHQKRKGVFVLLKNKALRLLIPYLGIGILWLLPIRLLIGFPSYQDMGAMDFAYKLLNSSDVGHLWFLPALFLIFLLAEVILTIGEKVLGIRKYSEVFLGVVALGLYLEGYRISFGYAPLQGAYGYLLWFSLGYFSMCNRRLLSRIYGVRIVKFGMLLLCAGLYGYCIRTETVRVLVSLGTKGLCILSIYGAMPENTCTVVEKIDRNSFGIYLFHSPLIYIIFANIPNANPAVVVFVNLVVFGAIAYGLTGFVRKTKLRVLIGEAL